MYSRSDTQAVETIPLRLMIVGVVIALSVLPAAQALDTLRNSNFFDRALQQIEAVADAAAIISIEGPGSVRTLSLDFSSNGELRFSSLSIGGPAGSPNSTMMLLTLSNERELARTVSADGTHVCSRERSSLQISIAQFALRMSAQFEKGEFWIQVEVV